MRHGLIVTQIALAFVLLSGAGLLGMSLTRLMKVSPGFQPDPVLAGDISLFWNNYRQASDRVRFVDRLVAEFTAIPGVTHAAVTDGLPMSPLEANWMLAVDHSSTYTGEGRNHYRINVSPGYWETMGIALKRGRLITAADTAESPRVCVVDEALVRHYWPNEDPIGRRVSPSTRFRPDFGYTVVGVVETVKQDGLSDPGVHGSVYFPYTQYLTVPDVTVVVRSSLPAAGLAPALQRVVRELDPALAFENIRPMQTEIDDSTVARKAPALLVGIFAGVALLLAAVGTYGVLAYAVSQRRREIGVRMALGALPGQILQQFLRMGTRLLIVGLALGTLGAWAAGRAMQNLLFEVEGFHPGVIAVTAIVMSTLVLLSSLLPSQRAARVSPLEALRAE